MDKHNDHIRNVLHGFFLSIGTTIAEPSTILPLIVNYLGGNSIVVGLFASLLRGGAIIVQLFAAFQAQEYSKMLPYLKRVFLIRFLAWFGIGLSIILWGETNPTLALICFGLGLFIFSCSAGFGAIYFKEIIAKIFTHKFRGKTMAYRQFFTAFGGLISGSIAAVILDIFNPPYSFGYLFIMSAFIMGLGYIAFSTVTEPLKEHISHKETSFRKFLRNAAILFKSDKDLQIQITTFLLAYGYLIALPFIILDAKTKIHLDAVAIGSLITAQMLGAMLSNILWGFLSSKGQNKLIAHLAISVHILAISLALIGFSFYLYLFIFFLIGASADGNRIASGNLILIIAPPEKRPIYVAIHMNLISIGLFFSIIGGSVLHYGSYTTLYVVSITMLVGALLSSFFLNNYVKMTT